MAIFHAAKEVTDLYNQRLAPYGVYVTVRSRYYEKEVVPYDINTSLAGSIINAAEYELINNRREKKYRKAPNRYHYLIMQIHPIKKGELPQRDRKQYAFLLQKTTRAHQGQEPIQRTVPESRILKRMERLLKKWLKKAEKQPENLWYRNDFRDAVRYTWMSRYDYLEYYCGKKKSFWDTLLPVVLGVLCILIVVVVYLIFHG